VKGAGLKAQGKRSKGLGGKTFSVRRPNQRAERPKQRKMRLEGKKAQGEKVKTQKG